MYFYKVAIGVCEDKCDFVLKSCKKYTQDEFDRFLFNFIYLYTCEDNIYTRNIQPLRHYPYEAIEYFCKNNTQFELVDFECDFTVYE